MHFRDALHLCAHFSPPGHCSAEFCGRAAELRCTLARPAGDFVRMIRYATGLLDPGHKAEQELIPDMLWMR